MKYSDSDIVDYLQGRCSEHGSREIERQADTDILLRSRIDSLSRVNQNIGSHDFQRLDDYFTDRLIRRIKEYGEPAGIDEYISSFVAQFKAVFAASALAIAMLAAYSISTVSSYDDARSTADILMGIPDVHLDEAFGVDI